MPILFSNNASAPLAASINAAATTITVVTNQGALFPAASGSNYYYCTLVDAANNVEIVKVTNRATDVFTVVRAQEGTTARSYAAADRIELRLTAAGLGNFPQLDKTQTFSGVNTFSGNVTFSASATFNNTITGSISGNAGTVTNGVYTTGAQTIGGVKTFSSDVVLNNALDLSIKSAAGVNTSMVTLTSSDGARWGYGTAVVSHNWYTGAVSRMSLNSSGNLSVTGTVTANSDERLKTDWASVAGDFVARLADTKSGVYTRLDTGSRQAGVGAQSLQKLLPEAVLEGEDGTLSVAYGNAALVACVELAKEVVSLRSEVAALKGA